MKLIGILATGVFVLLGSNVWANVVSIGTGGGAPGAELTIPVTVDSNTGGIASIDIDVLFDDSVLLPRPGGTACGFVEPGADLDTSKHGLACSEPFPGTLRVLINTLPALGNPPVVAMGTGEMVRLRFDIAGGATAPATLSLLADNTDASDTDGNTIPGVVFNDGTIEVLEVSAVLNVVPDNLNFGDEFTGSTSAPQAVTISNDGTDGVDLEISNIAVTGDFALNGPTCIGAVISDGNTCVQNVVFSPASDGPHAGILTVFSDAGEVLNDTVNLSGNAISPPTGLIFTVSPNYGVEGGPLFWGVEIQVLDANGALYTADSSSTVELSLETDPTGLATLSGMTQTTVANGVATFAFTDLSIDLVGTGFRLEVSDQGGSLNSALSDFFNVVEDQLLRDRFEQ